MISGFWIRVVVSLPIVFLPLVLAGPAGAQTADFGLFVPADDPGLPAASLILSAGGRSVDDGLTVRSRRVFADPAAFRAFSDALDVGGAPTAVRLNLFPGVVAESIVEWADLTAAGYSWGGGVAGDPFGSAAMAVNGDVVRGVVRTGGREYEIRRDGGGVLTIREVGRLRLPPPDRGALPGRAPRSVDRSAFVDPADRLDLAVFYSPGAVQIEGGRAGLRALVDSWVADVNAAYKRSRIDQVLTLVYLGPATYAGTDAESWICDLDSECGAVARRFRADLVHTLVADSDLADRRSVLGAARYPGRAGPVAGMTLISAGSAVFAHELGHNHGVSHDRYDRWVSCAGEGVSPVSTVARKCVNQDRSSTTRCRGSGLGIVR